MLSLALALPAGPVLAQEATPVAPPAAADTTRLVGQIVALRAINPLNLTAPQMTALLEVLKPAQEKQTQQDQASSRQLAAVVTQLRQALTQVAANPAETTPAEREYRRLRQIDDSSRDRTRAQLRDELRGALEKILGPDQQTAVIAAGHTLNVQRRVQEMGDGDRGPIDGVARSLDRLRQTDERRFQQERQSFALRQAGLGGGGVQMLRGGPGGGDARARGRGGQQDGLRQEQLRQREEQILLQLADPANQAKLAPYLSIADQVRRMPEAAYQRQRAQLALQVWQAGEERRVQTDPRQAVEQFITQILLTPGAVEVLEMKLKGGGAE